MPIFNVRHAECDDTGEGEFVNAKDAKDALAKVDPLFKYAADEDGEGGGDCDSWSGIKSHLKRIRPVAGSRPSDILSGTEPSHATVDGSYDYFLVYQVASVPAGKTILVPPKKE
jgi:hypothetical protein